MVDVDICCCTIILKISIVHLKSFTDLVPHCYSDELEVEEKARQERREVRRARREARGEVIGDETELDSEYDSEEEYPMFLESTDQTAEVTPAAVEPPQPESQPTNTN